MATQTFDDSRRVGNGAGSVAPVLMLPPAMQQLCASFLAAEGALNLASSCGRIKKDLGLSVLRHPRSQLSKRQSWIGGVHDGDQPRPWAAIKPVFRDRTQSLAFTCTWRDQGWGNRKSRIYIVEGRRAASGSGNDSCCNFLGGRVVAESPDNAEHHNTSLTLEFTPEEGLEYSVWYRVGGGGGHELRVKDATLYQTIFGDSNGALQTTYRALAENNLLGNPSEVAVKMTAAAARSLIGQLSEDKPPDANITSVFESAGVTVDWDHLETVVALLSRPADDAPIGGLQVDSRGEEHNPGPPNYFAHIEYDSDQGSEDDDSTDMSWT